MSIMRLCTICARGGSKGIPGKNLTIIAGKELLAHSIGHAQQSQLFSSIAVSSDSEAILDCAKKYGVEILIKRPPELATDTAAKLPVIQHAAKSCEIKTGLQYDIFCDLDATSPLRSVSDIIGAVRLMEERSRGNVITGSLSRRSPYFNLVEERSNGTVATAKKAAQSVVRRQDAPKTYDMNASIYVWNRDSLMNGMSVINDDTVLFEMPEERSLDIDSQLDLKIVKFLMESRGS